MKMIRLWHPMRDPYHCSFRLLTLLSALEEKTISIAKLSLLDLFLLFPQYLKQISLPQDAAKRRSQLKSPRMNDDFAYVPDMRLIYREIQSYQKVAMERLVAQNILSPVAYKEKEALLDRGVLSVDLLKKIDESLYQEEGLLSIIINDLGSLPMDGPDSLLRKVRLELGGRFH